MHALSDRHDVASRLVERAFELYSAWKLNDPTAAHEIAREFAPLDPAIAAEAADAMLSRIARPTSQKTEHVRAFFARVAALAR